MQITKKKNNKKKRKKQLSAEEKFQRQWARVQNFQKSNAKLRQEVTDFCQKVSQKIETKERLLCTAIILQTECLIHFVSKKTLPEYQREELVFWIERNLEEMVANPFLDHKDVMPLVTKLSEQLKNHEQNQFKKWKKKYAVIENDALDSDDHSIDEEVKVKEENANTEDKSDFDDFFAADDDLDIDNVFDEFFQEFFQEERSHFEKLAEKEREESNALSKLLKSTSVNKLFRRVAKALHPDLEQNEAIKEEKHTLMAELVEARDNKDIVKIITMYTEHVGEAPLDLFNGDYDKMTLLLKHQVKCLEQEKHDILEENPTQAAIYYGFHASSEAKVKQKIDQHLEELKDRTCSIQKMTGQLTSLKKIKPILQQMSAINGVRLL